MPSVLERITTEELVNYSRFFPMERPAFDGDTLFPDRKTEYFVAEYERLMEDANIPSMALVHALDTEAHIGTRPTAMREAVEKLFIKEKINLTERERLYLNRGVGNDGILAFIYDDIGRLMDSVRTRAEVAKMEMFTTGKMTVKENNLNITIDSGVPSNQIVTSDWSDPGADILGDIKKWLRLAEDHGIYFNTIMTSQAVIDCMCANEAIQTGINGSLNAGVIIGVEDLNRLFSRLFDGLMIRKASKGLYKYTKADGTQENKRFFPENKLVMYQSFDGSIGEGLWGTTPEELEYGAYSEKNQSMFITATKWSTPDPVAVWTKASGLMVPVIPNPNALLCATITLAGE